MNFGATEMSEVSSRCWWVGLGKEILQFLFLSFSACLHFSTEGLERYTSLQRFEWEETEKREGKIPGLSIALSKTRSMTLCFTVGR